MKTQRKQAGILLLALVAGAGLVVSNSDSRAESRPGMGSGMAMGDARARNADMLIKTLSEEKTEIRALAAQQAALRNMGGNENMRLASMFGRWIREHKAAGPNLERLIRRNGGDPAQARLLKPPVLGNKMTMLHATHMDHVAAVTTSQMRHRMTNNAAIKTAMSKRASLARKHLRQMEPYHNANNCPMCRQMGHKM